MGELGSHKQQRAQLVRSLRAQGKSWVEVAEALRQRFRLNARVALRYAHGWSQRQTADEWNKRWPDELKTFKMFSYWEMWPSRTGHAPSFDNLSKLAELYECAVSDLLADLPDFRNRDAAAPTAAAGLGLTDNFVTLLPQYLESLAPSDRDVLTTRRDHDRSFDQLVRFLTGWAHTMQRRKLLCNLSCAAATALLFPNIGPEEQQRVAAVLSKPSRVDAATIEHMETVLWRSQQLDDTLGPHAALDTVLAQRALARALERDCPAALRPRILSLLSKASYQAGWLSFDLNDFTSAQYYYDDARALAHEAGNVALGAFVLCNMSYLVTWQRKPRVGIDHAVAASEWAKRTGDKSLQAFAADTAARAYAADGQPEPCRAALETAQTTLTMVGDQQPSYAYFYDQGTHTGMRCSCHLTLREPQLAATYAQQSLKILDRSYTRDLGFVTMKLGIAHMQSHEIDEAARLLGDAGEIAARNSSARLAKQVQQARADMRPWQHTAAIRALDDRLASYGLA
jgi:transcriptional regulator with XRE-family HTH domain